MEVRYTAIKPAVSGSCNVYTGPSKPFTISATRIPIPYTTRDELLAVKSSSYGLTTNDVDARIAAAVAVPAFAVWTNQAGSVTISNTNEAPVKLYGTGAVSVAFSGMRPPRPLYLVMRGPSSVSWPANTHFVGGGTWQTNMSNHFVVWSYGTNLFVNPVTASED